MSLLKVHQAPATFDQIQFLYTTQLLDAIFELRRQGTIAHCLRKHDLKRSFSAQIFRAS